MEFITKLFDIDFAALVPEMDGFLGSLRGLLRLCILAGPIILLVLGALYLFCAPKEANYKFGFRTYFGMGSVEAWRFSQKIAGIAYAGVGVILLIVMIIVAASLSKDLAKAASTALTCLWWQVGLALAARITVAIMAAVYFDKNGDRRMQKNQYIREGR